MQTKVTVVLILLSIAFLCSCRSGQALNPTLNPTSTNTPLPTRPITDTPTPALTPTASLTPALTPTTTSSINLRCDDWALITVGEYQVQNNTYGKGDLSGWSQCIGLEAAANGAVSARWTWDWLDSGSNVKAYPEIIYGQKPGGPSTAELMPLIINQVGAATVSYDVASTHTGSGNLAFDIWLTDTQDPSTWGVPPITHEIMIWLESFGGMLPGGTRIDQAEIDGALYNVYFSNFFGQGWKYIAFSREEPQLGAGSLNLVSFLEYILEKGFITGDEYLASIEFGNEVIGGVGETVVNRYQVSVEPK